MKFYGRNQPTDARRQVCKHTSSFPRLWGAVCCFELRWYVTKRNHRDSTNDSLNTTPPWYSQRRSPPAPPLFSFFLPFPGIWCRLFLVVVPDAIRPHPSSLIHLPSSIIHHFSSLLLHPSSLIPLPYFSLLFRFLISVKVCTTFWDRLGTLLLISCHASPCFLTAESTACLPTWSTWLAKTWAHIVYYLTACISQNTQQSLCPTMIFSSPWAIIPRISRPTISTKT